MDAMGRRGGRDGLLGWARQGIVEGTTGCRSWYHKESRCARQVVVVG